MLGIKGRRMVEKTFKWLASISEKRPWWVIIVVLLMTAVAVVGFGFIRQEYGYKSMLPKNMESVKALEEGNELFGGTMEEQLLLESDKSLDPAMLRKAAGYKAYLETQPDIWGTFIISVSTPLDEMYYFPPGQPLPATPEPLLQHLAGLSDDELVNQININIEYATERAMQMGISGAGIQGISTDGKAILISTTVNSDTTTNDQIKLVGPFEKVNNDYFGQVAGLKVYESGQAIQNRDSNERMMKDTSFLFMLAFLFILLVLFLTFRRVSDVLLTMMVILVTIVWVMGLSGWLRFPFTYASVSIMPLLLGIDVAYAIHVMSRYYEEKRKGLDTHTSIITAVVTVGVAVFLTAATTAFGFASFGISNMPPIIQFGMLCVAGVMFSFFLAVTLLPATIVLRDRRPKAQQKWARKNEKRIDRNKESWLDKSLAKIAVLSEHHRAIVGIVTLLVLVGCFFLGLNISTEVDMAKMMPQDMPSMVAMNEINNRFGGQNVAYVLVKGDILQPANLRSMLAYEDKVASSDYLTDKGEPVIERQKVLSIADIVYTANQGTIPSSKAEVVASLMKLQNGSSGSSLRLVDEEAQVAIINIRVVQGTQTDMENITHIMRDSGAEIVTENSQITMTYSGMPVMMVDVLGSLVPTQLKTSGLALILCALIVILIFHSFIFGLAATSVVFISIALEIGVLVLLGWPLDFMTVMVSSLVIGAGIDFGIHITHRFREEWHQGMPVDEAIRLTVANVGKALVAAAITTAGAFAILAISNMVFLKRFGGITALSLTFALLSSLLVLPSILAWQANRMERKAQHRDQEAGLN
ncbi:MAG: hypothetical protein A2Y75_02285 [Candidatus Solincola sediminis]|uniref:SSD domain-containing protein n=1 Tax=Candidatus Solincola sediminis TaxID=1797199 RepID=A0A1F2WTI1_9ACTN|nr:MAG: hypothetical protein A2Y75_02285 [Candidatus Solincola sediminis]